MPTYTYRPECAGGNTHDRMRLELGDTTFAPGELTAALCDEEYNVLIEQAGANWKNAKLACLHAILMKFSHQVTMRAGNLSYNFSDRVDFWKKLYDDLKKDTDLAIPILGNLRPDGTYAPAYFYTDMHRNPERRDG